MPGAVTTLSKTDTAMTAMANEVPSARHHGPKRRN